MTLRPYQQACVRAVSDAWRRGVSRQLITMATGGGKSRTVTAIPDAIGVPRTKRILFLCHLEELVRQISETFEECLPLRSIGIEKAGERAGDASIVIGSIQTLGRSAGRLDQFNPDDFGLIIGDEVHLAGNSEIWRKILRHFHVLKGESPDDSKLLIGLTATPRRTDGVGLECLFDEIVFKYSWIRGVKEKWLVEPKCHVVETEIDLSNVAKRGGDFAIGELENLVNTRARNELVAQKYHELSPGCPALFFTTDIKHSMDLAEVLRANGIDAYGISGKTPKEERRELVRKFKGGEITGLCSCQVLTTGFDAPNATAAHLCRPTMSTLLLCQELGRVLRPYPAPETLEHLYNIGQRPDWIKANAVVVDYVDVCRRHSLITTPTLIGLKPNFDAKGQGITEVDRQVRELEQAHPTLDLRSQTSLDDIKSSIRSLDLMAPPEVPAEVRKVSKLAWLKEPSGRYHIGMVKDVGLLSITEDTLGIWHVARHSKGMRVTLALCDSFKEAVARAEREIPVEDLIVLKSKAAWRGREPKPEQCKYLWGIDREVRSRFRTHEEYYQHAVERYNAGDWRYDRGAISIMIDRARTANG